MNRTQRNLTLCCAPVARAVNVDWPRCCTSVKFAKVFIILSNRCDAVCWQQRYVVNSRSHNLPKCTRKCNVESFSILSCKT